MQIYSNYRFINGIFYLAGCAVEIACLPLELVSVKVFVDLLVYRLREPAYKHILKLVSTYNCMVIKEASRSDPPGQDIVRNFYKLVLSGFMFEKVEAV